MFQAGLNSLLFNPLVAKNNIETGRGYWAALPGSRRTMRRVFSQSLAAAPLGVGYLRFQTKLELHVK
jgi:hypothetical protein